MCVFVVNLALLTPQSRVCTATGRYREGEVLQAVLRGPSAEFHKYKIQWYHSKAPVTSYADCTHVIPNMILRPCLSQSLFEALS